MKGFVIKDTLVCLGSHGRRQRGASWPMENYFQAEAFNLDKVLDEFEQNEGELLCLEGCGKDTGPDSESLCLRDGVIVGLKLQRSCGQDALM